MNHNSITVITKELREASKKLDDAIYKDHLGSQTKKEELETSYAIDKYFVKIRKLVEKLEQELIG